MIARCANAYKLLLAKAMAGQSTVLQRSGSNKFSVVVRNGVSPQGVAWNG